jgi:LmbE family N-acetylglucosaminyl deacetylase
VAGDGLPPAHPFDVVLQLSPLPSERLRRVLVLGSHADDIEIGCGATLLALTRSQPAVEVTWVVLGAEGVRESEASASAEAFLADAASAHVLVHGFRDGFFPYVGGEVKDAFEELKARVVPDIVFTHTRHDLHQDHRLVCELTWNTWRDQLILEYEIPKYDGDLGIPNVYVPVEEDLAREKTALLLRLFGSQTEKHWFDEELFVGLMRLRGMEGRSPSGYAEAFTCRKLALRL